MCFIASASRTVSKSIPIEPNSAMAPVFAFVKMAGAGDFARCDLPPDDHTVMSLRSVCGEIAGFFPHSLDFYVVTPEERESLSAQRNPSLETRIFLERARLNAGCELDSGVCLLATGKANTGEESAQGWVSAFTDITAFAQLTLVVPPVPLCLIATSHTTYVYPSCHSQVAYGITVVLWGMLEVGLAAALSAFGTQLYDSATDQKQETTLPFLESSPPSLQVWVPCGILSSAPQIRTWQWSRVLEAMDGSSLLHRCAHCRRVRTGFWRMEE